jgi:hypothetical protein
LIVIPGPAPSIGAPRDPSKRDNSPDPLANFTFPGIMSHGPPRQGKEK